MEPYIAAMTAPTPRSLPFEVIEGDIGAYALESGPWLAVVSSNDSYLSHSDGAALAIWNASGLPEDPPQASKRPLPLGSVVRTESGQLKSLAIFHAVTLDVDTRTRLDQSQHDAVYEQLTLLLEALATGATERRVLLPLIGSEEGGPSEVEIADRIATLAARLQPSQVRLTILVPHGANRVRERICAGFGIVDVPVDLGRYLPALPAEPVERFSRCFGALETVLGVIQEVPAHQTNRSLGALWASSKARLERLPQNRVPWSGLQFMPEVIGFRNSVAHGFPPKQPPVIAANMTETSLRAALQVVESELIPGIDPQVVADTLKSPKDHASNSWSRMFQHAWGADSTRRDDAAASRSLTAILLRLRSYYCDPTTKPLTDDGKPSVHPGVGGSSEQAPQAGNPLSVVSGAIEDWPQRLAEADKALEAAGKSRAALGQEIAAASELLGAVSETDRPRSTLGPSESSHVRRLAKLLGELPEEDRNHLREKLDAMDYRGDDSKRLIEYCTREDPSRILDDLGTRRLGALLKDLGVDTRITDPMPVLRDRLLSELGFRIAAPLAGLQPALDDLTKHRRTVPFAGSTSIHGMVVKGSGRFERTIRDLLRFMCNYLFKRGPEEHFKGHLNDGASKDFGKATLGTLLHCLELLAKEIEKRARSGEQDADGTPPLLELQGPLSATRLAPKGVEGLSKLRNLFAHFEKEHGELHDREKAREFFDGAIEVLEHWMSADPPIYPKIIVVERISVDRWNRRTIETRTDAGEEEILICDDDLRPGDVYFMYPLSNPMRVDPILMRFEPDPPGENLAPKA
jgi:O-acetyl-ADP-ribose deacetylase (regulator of RNase III)